MEKRGKISISAVIVLSLVIGILSAANVLAAVGEGTATIGGTSTQTVAISSTTTFTVVLTVGATGIAIDADSPTFTIPAGFTAPDATEEVALLDVDAAGEWFAEGAGGTCAVTMGGAGTSATGQVMTVDVTGACAVGNTITLTYRGTASGTASALANLVVATDDASGGGPASSIGTPPQIAVKGTAVVAAYTTAGVDTTNNLAGKAKIGATDVVLGGFKITAAGETVAVTKIRTTVTLGFMVIGELTNLRIVPDDGTGAGDPDDGIMHAAELAAALATIASPVEGTNNFTVSTSVAAGVSNYFLVGTIASTVSDGDTLDVEATGAMSVSQGATSGQSITLTGTSANDARTITDTTAPTFTAATATTSTITVTFSENVDSPADDKNDWTVAGNTVSSISALNGAGSTMTITLGTPIATNAVPAVTYTAAAGDIVDTAASPNALATATVTPTDGIKPTFTAVRTALNTIVLTFSENVDVTTTAGQGYAVAGATVTGNTDPAGTGNTITLTTTGLTATDGTPAVTYTIAAGTTVDTAANEVADSATANAADQVKPTVVSAKVTGANAITVVYSEAVTSVFTDYTSLVLTAGGARGVTARSGSGTATIVLTFNGAAAAASDTGTMNIGATVVDTSAATNALTAVVGQEVTDGQKPIVTSAAINYGTGILNVTFSETIDASATDATKFHLNDITGTDDVTLSAAPANTDATHLIFTLTEAQRIAALAISGTTGGNGGAVVLDVDASAVADMSSNTNLISDANVVTETADTVKPTVTSATLNYGTGVLVVTFSETIDAGATTASKFHLNNVTGTDAVTLSVAPTDTDAVTLTFTLTEAQRVAALARSGTTGGDSHAVVLDVDAAAVTDKASNTNLIDDANVVTETADSVKPTVSSATLNYGTGVLVVTFSETIDASVTDATKFHLNDVTGTDDVTLSVAPTDTNAVTLTFTLTEAQRVAALAKSGVTGGNGGAVVLDVDALGVTDMATNTNLIDDANVVTETADTVKPTVTSATLNYGTRVLVVTFSETIDASATDATKFHLNDITGTDVVTLSAAPTDTDAVTLTFTLTEAQKVAALAKSGVTGGNGGAVVLDVDALGVTDKATNTNLIDDNNTVTETADTVKPTVTSATLNYGTGVLVVTFSETIDASLTNASKFHLNDLTGTDDVTLSAAPTNTDAATLTFTLTEAQRIAALAKSGVTGGNGGAVVLDVDALGVTDMASNTNLIDDANVVTETADTVKPTVTSATLNYGTGVLVVTFSETIDASATDATKFHLNDVTTVDDVTLSTAPTNTDAVTLTFTLTEVQRAAALAKSGVTGGNGGAVVLDVDALGVTDMASNTNLIDDNNAVTETADISAFEFPKGGNGFRTLPIYGDLISTYELQNTTIWGTGLMMSTFLTSTVSVVGERLASSDVNVVYVYNADSGWVTVDDSDFATWNVYDGFASLNYVVLDLKQDAYGKSIRHGSN